MALHLPSVEKINNVDTEVIQKLNTRPELKAEELKKRFDKAVGDLLNAVNERLNTINDIVATINDSMTDGAGSDPNKIMTQAGVNTAINERITDIGAGDMSKAEYDANNTGTVDEAKKVEHTLTAFGVTYNGSENKTIACPVATNVSVSEWISDNSYTGFKYKADIPITGVTANHMPIVILSPDSYTSAYICPIAVAGNGVVTIYSTSNTISLTIPKIVCVPTNGTALGYAINSRSILNLNQSQYGTTLPSSGVEGQVFFLLES